MTKTLSMKSHKNYNLNANEEFVLLLTFKFVIWFFGGFTLKSKFRSIAYLLNVSEHIYWIWDLEDEVHSIWDLWTSGLQECKGNDFFKIGRVGSNFWSGIGNQDILEGQLPLPEYSAPKRFVGGNLTSSVLKTPKYCCRSHLKMNPN